MAQNSTLFGQLFRRIATTTRSFSSAINDNIKTAGIIVIGDEILKGEVLDTNSNFIGKELRKLGLNLKKISVIGDDVTEVSKEVKYFSRTFDYVITTGGIGPTHDDITYEAVALAFNQPLYTNPILKEICMKFYNTTNENGPGMKLAEIPQSAKLTFKASDGTNMKYPNVSVQNVYMFPGIPELCRRSFLGVGKTLFKSNSKFYSKSIYCNLTEDKLVRALDTLVREFPGVQFGSYPKFDGKYKVKVTIESSSEETTNRAHERFLNLVPKEFIVDKNDIEV